MNRNHILKQWHTTVSYQEIIYIHFPVFVLTRLVNCAAIYKRCTNFHV